MSCPYEIRHKIAKKVAEKRFKNYSKNKKSDPSKSKKKRPILAVDIYQSTFYGNNSEIIPSKEVFRKIGNTWRDTDQSIYEEIAQEARKILAYLLENDQNFGQEHKPNMTAFVNSSPQFHPSSDEECILSTCRDCNFNLYGFY
ncbi:11327_t:CDS:1 [Ambispora leptoticha]|uniref:11327_t:CDS:1 n=1 Tax=Ambispora leptoticha TaxID=144679 RepID=A0A9N9BAN8_9GLOM|nr:11327_t:CDS:1 [Ambispora leptoticha]